MRPPYRNGSTQDLVGAMLAEIRHIATIHLGFCAFLRPSSVAISCSCCRVLSTAPMIHGSWFIRRDLTRRYAARCRAVRSSAKCCRNLCDRGHRGSGRIRGYGPTVGASISIRSVFAKYRAVLFEGEWKYCACSVEQGSMVFGKCTLPMTDVANGSQLGVWDLFHKMISSYATMSGCI